MSNCQISAKSLFVEIVRSRLCYKCYKCSVLQWEYCVCPVNKLLYSQCVMQMGTDVKLQKCRVCFISFKRSHVAGVLGELQLQFVTSVICLLLGFCLLFKVLWQLWVYWMCFTWRRPRTQSSSIKKQFIQFGVEEFNWLDRPDPPTSVLNLTNALCSEWEQIPAGGSTSAGNVEVQQSLMGATFRCPRTFGHVM